MQVDAKWRSSIVVVAVEVLPQITQGVFLGVEILRSTTISHRAGETMVAQPAIQWDLPYAREIPLGTSIAVTILQCRWVV